MGEGERGRGGGDDVSDEELRGEFDVELPISLQMVLGVTQLRDEHIKRRKYPDRDECVTPPLAADMPWTFLDDDPLGVFTELGGTSRPATPPTLRAVRLTSNATVNSIVHKFKEIRANLTDPVKWSLEKDKDALEQKEHLSSHDAAIKKYKNYVEKKPILPQPVRTAQGFKGVSGVPGRPMSGPGRPPARPPCSPHCLGCQCWFHGRCQGVPVGVSKFRCRNCHIPRSTVGVSGRVSSPARPVGQTAPAGFVKVRLPMPSTNGKRPIVELVMLTNGKYQPIKFTNNRQVTESIPKRLFDQATQNMKTLYQRSMQVPKIGTKQVFLAINPTPGGVRPYSSSPARPGPPAPAPQAKPQPPQKPVPQTSDQVSILVRPAAGGNAVLLNVPRSVAAKVKQGTTLSFSASNDQKYTVIDNKMHPPVGKQKPAPKPAAKPSPLPSRPTAMPSLPSGVSIRPVPPGASRKAATPFQAGGRGCVAPPRAPAREPRSQGRELAFTPCSPFG